VVTERFIRLSRSTSLRACVEQDATGLVVTLRQEQWPRSSGHTAVVELPPNRLHEVATALVALAGVVGVRP
jgi:hypothetical protein